MLENKLDQHNKVTPMRRAVRIEVGREGMAGKKGRGREVLGVVWSSPTSEVTPARGRLAAGWGGGRQRERGLGEGDERGRKTKLFFI
jgi:hypothetical protein